MALVSIPCTPNGQPEWTQRTQLDGVEYLLTFLWSQRDGHWSLSIADGDGEPLHTGLVLVTGLNLIVQAEGVRHLREALFVRDTTGANDTDPGFGDLGTRFLLLYIETGVAA